MGRSMSAANDEEWSFPAIPGRHAGLAPASRFYSTGKPPGSGAPDQVRGDGQLSVSFWSSPITRRSSGTPHAVRVQSATTVSKNILFLNEGNSSLSYSAPASLSPHRSFKRPTDCFVKHTRAQARARMV
jgi:hypothetical protein